MVTQTKSKPKGSTRPPRPDQPNPFLALALAAARAAADKKCENLKILDISRSSGFTDYFVICSAFSPRQVRAIADEVADQLPRRPRSIEGMGDLRWVVMDFGDIVVHIFLDALRDYYDLEGLWSEAPRVPLPADFFRPAATRLN